MRHLIFALIALTLLPACVADDKSISELTDGERKQLCRELAAQDPEECPGRLDYPGYEREECVADLERVEDSDSCPLTAGDLETYARQPCTDQGQRAASVFAGCLSE